MEPTDRYDVSKIIILSGWSLALLTCVTVVTAAVYQALTIGKVEDNLKGWVGMCLVFLFTNFVPIVKDFISK